MIDFRSDTVTKPTSGMLEAMMAAEVGDDVFNDDPTVNNLQRKAAALFGMEDALFVPSGTMSNQIAIKCHTQPGDEVICSSESHVYKYEGGGIAMNSMSSVRLIPGDSGIINSDQIEAAINIDDVHFPKSSLISLENTSNRGGGCCYDLNEIKKIRQVADNHDLGLHLDGARLFNAMVANNENPKEYGLLFDSISICLSKGLGAPVGSILLGDHDFIKQARRIRKVFGGGMRQAGYLAAAGIYALDNHIDRLAIDHLHTKIIFEAVSNAPSVKKVMPVQTNILVFELKEGISTSDCLKKLEDSKILAVPFGPQKIRLVCHLGISDNNVEYAIQVLKDL